MATLTNGGMATKKKTMLQTRLSITEDDSKVLGRTTNLRREKTATKDQVHTLKLKTANSAWTPVVHKPSNEQIFKERRDLVSHWFDLWTDSQRKRFFDVVFRQCTRSQYKFVQDWFRDQVPMQHLDFSTVLPRFLSLYIFSFLEPKSLCRCAQVSWTWKFLSEQSFEGYFEYKGEEAHVEVDEHIIEIFELLDFNKDGMYTTEDNELIPDEAWDKVRDHASAIHKMIGEGPENLSEERKEYAEWVAKERDEL